MPQHIEAREYADHSHQHRRRSDANDRDARRRLPRQIQCVPSDRPAESDRTDGAHRPGDRAEHTVFEHQHGRDQPAIRTECLEDSRLIHASELRHGDGADENQYAAEQDKSADDRHGERHVRHEHLNSLQNLA